MDDLQVRSKFQKIEDNIFDGEGFDVSFNQELQKITFDLIPENFTTSLDSAILARNGVDELKHLSIQKIYKNSKTIFLVEFSLRRFIVGFNIIFAIIWFYMLIGSINDGFFVGTLLTSCWYYFFHFRPLYKLFKKIRLILMS